ncbi:MAG: mechanosensitive ion channel [Longimicrobiales bacterium]|nr:mechanosensitive ion channel [Longimicrobiales bacterium]
MANLDSYALTLLTEWGFKLLGALATLLIGRWVAGAVRAGVRRALERGGADPTLVPFLANLGYVVILTGIFIAAGGMIGVNPGSFIAIVGAAGLAIALAFQGTLSHLASGIMILTFRPFRVGDFVDAGGTAGSVQEIGVFTTTLTTPDNVRIIVPNSQISSATIRNFSANHTRRIDLVVGVGYEDDLDLAMRTIREIVTADERVLTDPELQVAVSEMADSSVNFVVRPWVNTPDYWPTRFALVKALKEGLEAAGCSIPYPQRDVHLSRTEAE